MPMMATTIISSIRVKPRWRFFMPLMLGDRAIDVCWLAHRGWSLNQVELAELRLAVGVEDRRGDEAGQTERRLEDDHGAEELPGGSLDLAADDARVQEVFELVDDDQERERAKRHAERDRQADDDDDRVRDQVADHRQQAAEEGDGHQRL